MKISGIHVFPLLAEPFTGGATWIGSDTAANRNFNGTLDEVAVFVSALSEMQIQDLFLKAIGASGVAPIPSSSTVYPAASVYSGQNVELSSTATGTLPLSLRWQSSPDGSKWTDVPGAISSTLLANPLTVGTVYYQLVASNPVGSGTNAPTAIAFSALPASPAGLWTANFQITNNIINYTTGGGVGNYVGRGILGTGAYWNVLPDSAGAFATVAQIDSASDYRDDGATHSGVYCHLYSASGFASATVTQPDSSDIGNLLYQYVTISGAGNPLNTNALQFSGLPDGTYNLVVYACDGSFGDRGTTFVVHDSLNGDQTGSTVNAAPIVPLQTGVNFVLFTGVHVAAGTLNVDVDANSPLPSHSSNTEADLNAAQLQLVSYDVPAPKVVLTTTSNGKNMSLAWPEGILQTSTNLLGPWSSIYSPSPVVAPVSTTGTARFYRVKVE